MRTRSPVWSAFAAVGLLALVSGCTLDFSNPRFEDQDGDGVTPALGDCDDANPAVSSADGDSDCDGVPTEDDCDDYNPESYTRAEDGDCDGVLPDDDCDDGDAGLTATVDDGDCDGALTVDDCDDGDAGLMAVLDDGDCDGVLTADDCDDGDAGSTAVVDDGDCDGILTFDDCDDGDPGSTAVGDDGDCDGVLTADDCDDGDDSLRAVSGDADCDGLLSADDCDDTNPASTSRADDRDCDGVATADDCDDLDATLGGIADDGDCDGVLAIEDCDDADPGPTLATLPSCPGLSCLDILEREPRSADGLYWLDPFGTGEYQVLCDMTSDGGGWTMIMKAVNDNYGYLDVQWENDDVDNETELDPTSSGKAKYQAFMDVGFGELRTSDPWTWSIDEVYAFSAPQSSATSLFNGGGIIISSSLSSYFNNRAPSAYRASGCTYLDRYGINTIDALGCGNISSGGCFVPNGGARFGNRVRVVPSDPFSIPFLVGQGWGAYRCGGPAGPTISELLWVR